MLILIDGYNLIRQSDALRRYERVSLEAGRKALINKLILYRRKRAHPIVIVFDGGGSGWADEEKDKQGGIHIVYSRSGEKADDVIKRLASHAMEETIVVSSDREISSYVTRHGKTCVSSPEFEAILNNVISSSFLDSAASADEDDMPERQSKKKGPARRLSKAKRHAQIKIKKL